MAVPVVVAGVGKVLSVASGVKKLWNSIVGGPDRNEPMKYRLTILDDGSGCKFEVLYGGGEWSEVAKYKWGEFLTLRKTKFNGSIEHTLRSNVRVRLAIYASGLTWQELLVGGRWVTVATITWTQVEQLIGAYSASDSVERIPAGNTTANNPGGLVPFEPYDNPSNHVAGSQATENPVKSFSWLPVAALGGIGLLFLKGR